MKSTKKNLFAIGAAVMMTASLATIASAATPIDGDAASFEVVDVDVSTLDFGQMLEHAWDSEADLFPDTLKYHIHAIKKKLAEAGCGTEPIRDLRGVGYWIGDGS